MGQMQTLAEKNVRENGFLDSIFRAGRVDTTDVFIFMSQCSTKLTHQPEIKGYWPKRAILRWPRIGFLSEFV